VGACELDSSGLGHGPMALVNKIMSTEFREEREFVV
jgi:hypothetical protein